MCKRVCYSPIKATSPLSTQAILIIVSISALFSDQGYNQAGLIEVHFTDICIEFDTNVLEAIQMILNIDEIINITTKQLYVKWDFSRLYGYMFLHPAGNTYAMHGLVSRDGWVLPTSKHPTPSYLNTHRNSDVARLKPMIITYHIHKHVFIYL